MSGCDRSGGQQRASRCNSLATTIFRPSGQAWSNLKRHFYLALVAGGNSIRRLAVLMDYLPAVLVAAPFHSSHRKQDSNRFRRGIVRRIPLRW